MDRHIARTIVRNSAGDARVIWSIFSGYHPQELRESGAGSLQPRAFFVVKFLGAPSSVFLNMATNEEGRLHYRSKP